MHYTPWSYLSYSQEFVPFINISPSLPTITSLTCPSPGNHHSTRLLWVQLFRKDSTYKWEHLVFDFLCLTWFTQHNALNVHPYYCKWQDFFLFYSWIMSYCVYIWSLSRKSPPIVNIMRTVCAHWCNLAAKESGLECTCMNNDNFTVLVSGGGRCHWVSMCTVWPLHSKWLSK